VITYTRRPWREHAISEARRTRSLARLVPGVALALALAAPADAETAWVRGAPLNLRSGAGTEFKILATVPVGAEVDVLQHDGAWTRIRLGEGRTGWIAAGYLEDEPPPALRVGELESEVGRLSAALESTTSEATGLRESQAALQSEDATRTAKLARLEQENLQLRAGARWPEWVTGALILSTGMALGAVLRGVSGRRRQSRLRL